MEQQLAPLTDAERAVLKKARDAKAAAAAVFEKVRADLIAAGMKENAVLDLIGENRGLDGGKSLVVNVESGEVISVAVEEVANEA